MNYQETPPSPRLAGYVKCFWALEFNGVKAGEPEPVVPDGGIEIVFNLADRFRRFHDNGDVEVQPSSLIHRVKSDFLASDSTQPERMPFSGLI